MSDSSSMPVSVSRKSPWLFLSVIGIVTYMLSFDSVIGRVMSHVFLDGNVGRASKNTSCQRPCPFRRNVIVLDHLFPAGLNDRTRIFQIMTNLAGYLCATVYVPPPWTMVRLLNRMHSIFSGLGFSHENVAVRYCQLVQLSIPHNRWSILPKNLSWNDFYTFTFRDDHTMALLQYEPPTNSLAKSFNVGKLSMFRPPNNKLYPFLRLELRENTDFLPQMERLDRFVTRQQQWNGGPEDTFTAFLWEIYIPTYHFDKERTMWIRNQSNHENYNNNDDDDDDQRASSILDNPDHGCQYTWEQDSSLSLEISNLIFDRIQAMHPTTQSLALLHIRRTDVLDTCNTSVATMHDFLSCSFAPPNTIASHFGPITVLLATDEQNSCYRFAMEQIITQGLGFGFVDLDAMIEETINQYSVQIPDGDRLRNNMFLFHIYNVMAKDPRIQIFLEKRRQFWCPNCTNVMETLAMSTGQDNTLSLTNKSEIQGPVSGWNLSETMNHYQHCINPSSA